MRMGIVSFQVESQGYKFKEPLMLKVEYVPGGVCLTTGEEPLLSACGKSFGDCETIVRDQLALIWKKYALTQDAHLTLGGIALKNKLLAMVEEMK